MKIKKLVPVSMMIIMVIGCMTGCGKRPTAESLMNEYVSLVTDAQSMIIDTEMLMGMNVAEGSTSMELKMEGNIKTAIVKEDEENYTSKTKTNMTVSMFGMSEKVKSESYDVCEDGEITRYNHDLDDDSWYTEYSYIEQEVTQLETLKNYFGSFELQKKTQKVGNIDCYVLTGALTGNDVMDEMVEELDLGFDAEDFKVNCTMYMNKENHEPVRIEIVCDESFLEKEMDFDDYTMSITEFKMTMDLSKINSTSEIKVPEEAMTYYYTGEENEDVGYGEDDNFFVNPEENEEPIEQSQPAMESFEVGNPDMGEMGLNALENQNISFRSYEVKDEYGATTVYLVGINTSSKDKAISMDVQFCKNGEIVDDSYRYLNIEEGCYEVTSLYTLEEYDEIKFKLTGDDSYHKLAGSKIDVDYSFGNGKFFGTITNNTEETIQFPMVKFVIWGPEKNVLYFNDTYAEADELAPGTSSKFEGYYNYDEKITDFNFYVTGEVKE